MHVTCRVVRLAAPYVPGFLAFREAEPLMALLEELRATRPELVPQVLLVDGNGVLHPQGCGLACHVALRTGVCAVGVAKTFLQVDGLEWARVRAEFGRRCGAAAGSWVPLVGASGTRWGAAAAPAAGLKKPVFVSVGSGLSSLGARGIACQSRSALPTRARAILCAG